MLFDKPFTIKQPEARGLIRELRLLTGLTQEQFAVYLGITKNVIGKAIGLISYLTSCT